MHHYGQRRFALALSKKCVWKEKLSFGVISCTGNILFAVCIISMDRLSHRGRSAVIQ